MFIRVFASWEQAFIGTGELVHGNTQVDLEEFRHSCLVSCLSWGRHSECSFFILMTRRAISSCYLTRPCKSIFCCLVYWGNLE